MSERDYDLIVRGGFVVDGTGLPRRRVDVGVRAGRIAKLGHLDDATAREEIDAAGAIVAPGIIDLHTHYDPQITFDPYATMSCYHGVTTVMAGNCGFSVAPCRKDDTSFLKDIFASVEDMDPIALSGVRWDQFETFPEFMQSLKGKLGINFACYIGHSNVRRWVMGDDCLTRTATQAEIAQMVAMVGEAMDAGAAGFSSSNSPTQADIHGRPVPSRFTDEAELSALVAEVGRRKSGSISYLPKSVMEGTDEHDRALLVRLALKSGIPVIIQGIGGRSKVDIPSQSWESASNFLADATAQGAPVYSLFFVQPNERAITLGPQNKHYRSVFSWHEMFKLPIEERRALLKDPEKRAQLARDVGNHNRNSDLGNIVPPPEWGDVFVDLVALEKNKGLEKRSVLAIAKEQGKTPAQVFLDLALEEDFKTELSWRTESKEWAQAIRASLPNANMIPGTSDGGAHLARFDGADWSSFFLRRWVIDEKLWSLEEGIRRITQVPAALAGLHDRGTLRVGGWADIMIFDPKTIAPSHKQFTNDLPGNVGRWRSWGKGVKATIVNGEPIVLDGKLTGRMPGQVVSPN